MPILEAEFMNAASRLIVAHRGDHSRVHENTLEAAQYAIDDGADMVELDVRRTREGELIVYHDEAIGGDRLSEMDYGEALGRASIEGYVLPRLSEMVAFAKGRIRLDIEIKETGYEEEILRTICDDLSLEDFFITSFAPSALAQVRRLNPAVRLGILCSDIAGPAAFQTFRESPADFLAPEHAMLDDATLADAARSKIPILPWTVNDPALIARYLQEPSVFGVVTDRPVEALRIRGAQSRSPQER
jgi:glycerophosphoryl diester phosphodiesterase